MVIKWTGHDRSNSITIKQIKCCSIIFRYMYHTYSTTQIFLHFSWYIITWRVPEFLESGADLLGTLGLGLQQFLPLLLQPLSDWGQPISVGRWSTTHKSVFLNDRFSIDLWSVCCCFFHDIYLRFLIRYL